MRDIRARESNHFLIGGWEVLQGQPDVAQTGSRHQFEAVDPPCHGVNARPFAEASLIPIFVEVSALETWKML